MFGDNRQYKQLVAKGEKAPAEVTAAKQGHMTTVTQEGALGTTNWTVTVMVQPEHEAAFEATVHRRMTLGNEMLIGSKMFVLYDPDDHSKVMEERDEAGILDQMASTLSGKPGRGSTADIASALSEVTKNPDGYDKAALIRAIGGDATGVTQDTKFVNLSGDPHLGWAPGDPAAGAAAGAVDPNDPVTKLTQLADLRDRGVLSSDEFEAQKARILGESGA
jgi:Short C-terminal domain